MKSPSRAPGTLRLRSCRSCARMSSSWTYAYRMPMEWASSGASRRPMTTRPSWCSRARWHPNPPPGPRAPTGSCRGRIATRWSAFSRVSGTRSARAERRAPDREAARASLAADSAGRVRLPDEPHERLAAGTHPDLPCDPVRRLARRPDAARMDAAEVMPGAERDPVLALVAATVRAEDDVVIVEVPPRRADGDRAPPSIAGKDRIPMAGLTLPLGLHVQEERLEPADQRIVRMGEGEDRGPEECDDGDGCRERDLRVRELPFRTRTQLPRVERERCAGGRRGDRHEAVADGERPLDLVGEATHGNGAGALDPGSRRRLGDDRENGESPDPGQRTRPVGFPERVRLPRLPFDRDQRTGFPGRDP